MRERAETMFLLTLQSVGGTLQRGAEGGSEAILHSWYKPTTDPYKPCECGFRGGPLQKQRPFPLQAATRTSSGDFFTGPRTNSGQGTEAILHAWYKPTTDPYKVPQDGGIGPTRTAQTGGNASPADHKASTFFWFASLRSSLCHPAGVTGSSAPSVRMATSGQPIGAYATVREHAATACVSAAVSYDNARGLIRYRYHTARLRSSRPCAQQPLRAQPLLAWDLAAPAEARGEAHACRHDARAPLRALPPLLEDSDSFFSMAV